MRRVFIFLLPILLTGCEFLTNINAHQFPEQERGVVDGVPLGRRQLNSLQEHGIILADSVHGTHIIIPADKCLLNITGEVTINPDFYSVLNELIHVLKGYPKVTLQVVGHTDGVMSPDLQVTQSSRYAQTLTEYLTSGGISPLRITSVRGVSDSQPISRASNATARAMNRRVEIITSAPLK